STAYWRHVPGNVYDAAYFGMVDSMVDEARARGFQVELTLSGLASAQFGGPDRAGINPDPGEFAVFCNAAARHFAGRVRRFSIWNEPNYIVFLLVAPPPLLARLRWLATEMNDPHIPQA